MRHEIVSRNPDVEVRFYMSVDTGSYVEPHWHDSIEIVYVLNGSIQVSCENKKITVGENEFVIVNSRTVHSVLSGKNKALVLQIPKEMLRKYKPDIDMYNFEISMNPSGDVEKTRLERVKKIFTDMYVIYDIRPEGYLLKFNSLLYELLYQLIHSYSHKIVMKENINKESKQLDRLNDIMTWIKQHYREKISVAELAKEYGYNKEYLSRFFKAQTGMTIIDYLYTYRITRVCQELLNTAKPVSEIFDENGCSNRRVAMRIFKEIYRCTPAEKRKQN